MLLVKLPKSQFDHEKFLLDDFFGANAKVIYLSFVKKIAIVSNFLRINLLGGFFMEHKDKFRVDLKFFCFWPSEN